MIRKLNIATISSELPPAVRKSEAHPTTLPHAIEKTRSPFQKHHQRSWRWIAPHRWLTGRGWGSWCSICSGDAPGQGPEGSSGFYRTIAYYVKTEDLGKDGTRRPSLRRTVARVPSSLQAESDPTPFV